MTRGRPTFRSLNDRPPCLTSRPHGRARTVRSHDPTIRRAPRRTNRLRDRNPVQDPSGERMRAALEQMPAEPILVTKASGERVPFDVAKLRGSLERSGATPEMSGLIAEKVLSQLHAGITTRKVYRLAFGLLHKRAKHLAARYRLKQAILELGPTGFPFERFVARILEHEGYRTQVGVVVEGRCVKHEVDVIADRDAQHFLVECKYHNTPGRVCDVKVPLYIHARFLDVVERWQKEPGNGHRFHQGWLVTNTRFTGDAVQFGQCAGLRMVGWDHPVKGSLKDRIDRSGLYPLTCLGSLTKAEKERLLDHGLLLARDVVQDPEALARALVRAPHITAVLAEAHELCALTTERAKPLRRKS